MDKAVVVFSRRGLMKSQLVARDVRSREQARKLWPLVDPEQQDQLVTWISPVFDGTRLKKRSHFRRLPSAGAVKVKVKDRFQSEETERQRLSAESSEHAEAKRLIAAELRRRMDAGLGLPWAFKDDSASDFSLVGNLLLGANEVVTERRLSTSFGCSYRLDIAVLAEPIDKHPRVVGGIEVERWHHFDARKALIGRSMGFPLITVDITDLQLTDLTEAWAADVLTNTTRDDPFGRRRSYIYLHDLLYPEFVTVPNEVEDDVKHQYLVFADDETLERLFGWVQKLGIALRYQPGQIALGKVNAKSPSARANLESAGSIAGEGWHEFNNQRMLRISVPKPVGPHDHQGHKFHSTLARLLLSQDCLVGYQYARSEYNNDRHEDVWLKYKWRPERGFCEVYRILPKRLSEPIGRIVAFMDAPGSL